MCVLASSSPILRVEDLPQSHGAHTTTVTAPSPTPPPFSPITPMSHDHPEVREAAQLVGRHRHGLRPGEAVGDGRRNVQAAIGPRASTAHFGPILREFAQRRSALEAVPGTYHGLPGGAGRTSDWLARPRAYYAHSFDPNHIFRAELMQRQEASYLDAVPLDTLEPDMAFDMLLLPPLPVPARAAIFHIQNLNQHNPAYTYRTFVGQKRQYMWGRPGHTRFRHYYDVAGNVRSRVPLLRHGAECPHINTILTTDFLKVTLDTGLLDATFSEHAMQDDDMERIEAHLNNMGIIPMDQLREDENPEMELVAHITVTDTQITVHPLWAQSFLPRRDYATHFFDWDGYAIPMEDCIPDDGVFWSQFQESQNPPPPPPPPASTVGDPEPPAMPAVFTEGSPVRDPVPSAALLERRGVELNNLVIMETNKSTDQAVQTDKEMATINPTEKQDEITVLSPVKEAEMENVAISPGGFSIGSEVGRKLMEVIEKILLPPPSTTKAEAKEGPCIPRSAPIDIPIQVQAQVHTLPQQDGAEVEFTVGSPLSEVSTSTLEARIIEAALKQDESRFTAPSSGYHSSQSDTQSDCTPWSIAQYLKGTQLSPGWGPPPSIFESDSNTDGDESSAMEDQSSLQLDEPVSKKQKVEDQQLTQQDRHEGEAEGQEQEAPLHRVEHHSDLATYFSQFTANAEHADKMPKQHGHKSDEQDHQHDKQQQQMYEVSTLHEAALQDLEVAGILADIDTDSSFITNLGNSASQEQLPPYKPKKEMEKEWQAQGSLSMNIDVSHSMQCMCPSCDTKTASSAANTNTDTVIAVTDVRNISPASFGEGSVYSQLPSNVTELLASEHSPHSPASLPQSPEASEQQVGRQSSETGTTQQVDSSGQMKQQDAAGGTELTASQPRQAAPLPAAEALVRSEKILQDMQALFEKYKREMSSNTATSPAL